MKPAAQPGGFRFCERGPASGASPSPCLRFDRSNAASCRRMRMVAACLRPRPETASSLDAIVRELYDADAGLLHHDNLSASPLRRRKILIASHRVHRPSAPSPTGTTNRTARPLCCPSLEQRLSTNPRNGSTRRNATHLARRAPGPKRQKPGPMTRALKLPKRRSIRGRGLRSAS